MIIVDIRDGKYKGEEGFVYILFFFLLPVFLLLVSLVIDSSNMYSASIKANAAAEEGVISALFARVNERDPSILAKISSTSSTADEKAYLEMRAKEATENNLLSSGVLQSASGNKNRAYIISSIIPNADLANDTLTVNVNLRVPTLFMHYLTGKGSYMQVNSSQIIKGRASNRLKGGNYVFLIDLSQSQGCPAGRAVAGGVPEPYCRCNSSNKFFVPNGTGGTRPETCDEEALRVPGPMNGLVRAQLTRDALIKAIRRLDSRRDRVAVIGFNSVAFPIVTFNDDTEVDPYTGIIKAKKGFVFSEIETALKQIKSIPQAISEFSSKPRIVGAGNKRVPLIVPEGNTNLSDAFITAFQEAKLAKLTSLEREKFNVIYYSDGAATALRGNFRGVSAPTYVDGTGSKLPIPRTFSAAVESVDIPKNSYPANPFGVTWTNDLINYQVVLSNGMGSFQYSLGPLVDASLYKRWYMKNQMDISDPAHLGKGIVYTPRTALDAITDPRKKFEPYLLPDCHCFDPGPGAVSCNNTTSPTSLKTYIYNKKILDFNTTARKAAFTPCFSGNAGKVEIQYPTADAYNSTGDAIAVADMFTASKDFRYLYYMAAMESAELLRQNGGRVHAIGYGEEAGTMNDPVQSLNDVAGLKAAVMANLASAFDDLTAMFQKYDSDGKPLKDPNFTNVPQFNNSNNTSSLFPGYQNLADRKGSGVPGGVFYKTPDPAQFESFLNLLISQIRMSMIEVN